MRSSREAFAKFDNFARRRIWSSSSGLELDNATGGIMDVTVDMRTHLNSIQTKSFLSEHNASLASLSDFERLKLDQEECCRTLLVNFAYCWSVAEASGLAIVAELAEIGIIEMSVRLGYNEDDIRKSSQKSSINGKSICSSPTGSKTII